MSNTPKDIDIWQAFIKTMDSISTGVSALYRSKSKKEATESKVPESPEWVNYTQGVPTRNNHGKQYTDRQSSLLNKKKQPMFVTPAPKYFIAPLTPDLGVAPMDASELKGISKLQPHQVWVIDLHGYSLSEAHHRLEDVFKRALTRHIRVLRIITGKGRDDHSAETLTLRRIFPQWMRESFFESRIVKYRQASPEQGGAGAFIIFLK